MGLRGSKTAETAHVFPAQPQPLGKVAARAQFDVLLEQGVHHSVAARRVGVTVKTGRYWMQGVRKSHGRTIYPGGRVTGPAAKRPARNKPMDEVVGTGRLLSLQERLVIADGLVNQASMRSIAARLGRPAATVTRAGARPIRRSYSATWPAGERVVTWGRARVSASSPMPTIGSSGLGNGLNSGDSTTATIRKRAAA